jgi:hypothetical protein
MSHITELAAGQINTSDTITVELGGRRNLVIIRWAGKPTVVHLRRFPAAADAAARVFAAAVVKLAQIRRDRRV